MHLQMRRQTAEFELAGGIGGWNQDAEMASHAKCFLCSTLAQPPSRLNRISSGSPSARNPAPAAPASTAWGVLLALGAPGRQPPSHAVKAWLTAAVSRWHFVGGATRLANPIEVSMPSKAAGKASRSLDPIDFQRLAAVVPFLDQGLAHAEAMAFDRRPPIGPHADLGKAGDLLGKFLRLGAGAALGGEVFTQAERQALVRRHLAPGEDDFQGATQTDDARQAHGSAINQGHTPASTINAKIGILRHHPKIAPQPQLHAPGDGRTFDGGNDGLVQLKPGGPQGPTR